MITEWPFLESLVSMHYFWRRNHEYLNQSEASSAILNFSEMLQPFVVSLVTGHALVLTHKSEYDIQTDARHISITKAEMKTHKFITVIGFRK